MLLARYQGDKGEGYGVVEGEQLRPIAGDPFGNFRLGEESMPIADVRFLAPTRPSKIVAAAVNYPSHVPQGRSLVGGRITSKPELFLKPPSSVTDPGGTIVLPLGVGRVDCEGELVAVVGRRCRNVSESAALDYVLGYTCGNDVSARDWQKDDLQWWRAKGCDTFAPVGPCIATGIDPTSLELRTRLNGETCQSASTSLLIHSVASLVSTASRVMTLEPGDLVFTGTPGDTSPLSPGDVVEVEIEGIGVLRNLVRSGS